MIKILQLSLLLLTATIGLNASAIEFEKPVTEGVFFEEDETFLDVDDAFKLSSDLVDDEFIIRWQIAEGYYLYKHRFAFSAKGATLEEAYIPGGLKKTDEYFGEVEVYYKHVEISIPFKDAGAVVALTIMYQGCADAGLCYTPAKRYLVVERQADGTLKQTSDILSKLPTELTNVKTKSGGNKNNKKSAQKPSNDLDKPIALSATDTLSETIDEDNMFWTLMAFLGAGLLLTFTPCVLPMIPILSGIIAGQGKDITPLKAFRLSFVYVQSMAITYAILGILVARAGSSLSGYLQSPVILIIVAVLFILLAFSMFGMYEIQLPGFIQNKIQGISEKQKGGNYLGVAVMGVISTLIVSPCTTAPLTAALLIIANSGDLWLGGWSLYFLGLGMGIPLLIIGVSQGRLLPKAGVWMDKIKQLFGFMMLGMALYITDHLIPGSLYLLIWASLLIVAASVFGAFSTASTTSQSVVKGLALTAFLIGVIYLLGAALGNDRLTKPLANIQLGQAAASQQSKLNFQSFKNLEQLEQRLKLAKAANQPVMIDFFAEWCVACYEFEDYTFSNPKVVEILTKNNVLLLQADVTDNTEDDLALLKTLEVIGLPAILFYGTDGVELKGMRATGFEDATQFADRLNTIYK